MVLNLQTSSVFAAWKISVVRCLKQKPQMSCGRKHKGRVILRKDSVSLQMNYKTKPVILSLSVSLIDYIKFNNLVLSQ